MVCGCFAASGTGSLGIIGGNINSALLMLKNLPMRLKQFCNSGPKSSTTM